MLKKEKQGDPQMTTNVPSEIKYHRSIKNYMFIQSENDIVAIHPVNPTFDLLNVANVRYGTSFCNSRQYGTFYITHKGLAIAQSPKYDANDVHLVYRSGAPHKRWNQCFSMDSSDDFKADEIQKCMYSLKVISFKSHFICSYSLHTVNTLAYDEGFGISGRLVAHCSVNGGSTLCQFFNREELDILSDSLWECGYYRNRGSDTKTFDTTLFVFEMIYGSELVDAVLERYERERAHQEREDKNKVRKGDLGPGGDEQGNKAIMKLVEGAAGGDNKIERGYHPEDDEGKVEAQLSVLFIADKEIEDAE